MLWTPLRAGDSQVYAVGQGTIVIGQASGTGSQVQTVAVIPNGASVEREFKPDFSSSGTMLFSLKNADFTTNTRISDAINEHLRGFYARSVDPVSIEITIPESFRGKPVEFVSEIEGLRVAVDRKAVVVMNERTGTVVMGADVTIGMVTIAHGSLSIQVGAMGGSSGKSGAKSGGKGKDSSAQNVVSMGGTNVGKLVETLNALGVKPADLIGIMQAIHAAGALQAELRLL